jgi:outer membrane lipoprotein-sorting protein
MKRRLAAIAGILFLSGCATVTMSETSIASLKTGQIPELSVESSVSTGSPIFAQFQYWSRVGYRLKGNLTTRVGLGRVMVSNGEFLGRAQVEGEDAYCTESLTYIDPLTGPLKTACFLDSNKDGRFDFVKAAPGMIWFEYKLDAPIDFEKSELIVTKMDAKKSELLYQGFSGNILRISFREYINDMARPSYFQDVTYDIPSFPTDITFKTVKLQVLSAGNNGIRYKILSGF